MSSVAVLALGFLAILLAGLVAGWSFVCDALRRRQRWFAKRSSEYFFLGIIVLNFLVLTGAVWYFSWALK